MNLAEIGGHVDRVLNTVLFQLSGRGVTLVTLLVFLLMLALAFWVARLLERLVRGAFVRRGVSDPGMVGNLARLIRYVALAVGVAMALQNLGLDLGALFTAGAIFAVALGFAMQGVVQNFVSGVLLLAERIIKNGDVLEVDGTVVRVKDMRLRVTVARTRDEEDLVIPNTALAQNTIKNYTLNDSDYRLKSTVGVTYGSDMKQVMEVLRAAATAVPFRLDNRQPVVLLTDFGDSSVNFEVQVWTHDPWGARQHTSLLNQAIWHALRASGITIAFPQLDLHLDPPVVESLQRLPRVV